MKETIILAPGAGGSELLRTLAKFGRNTLGVRVLGSVELAKYALMKAGVSVTEEFLTVREEYSVIYSFLKEIDYFRAASFADAESLASALTTMRSLIPDDEGKVLKEKLSVGEFPEKNRAVLEVYDRYRAKCEEDGRIDSISLVRKAIDECGPLIGECGASDAGASAGSAGVEFLTLAEYPLTPVDTALISAVSGGSYREISLAELFGSGLSGLVFTEGYGRINEVEDILDRIFSSNTPLDKCVIAAADTSSYAQVLYDLSSTYGIPVTYGCGVPILNSGPARLLKLIYQWKTTGYFGIDGLIRILNSEAFDRGEFAKTLGLDEVMKRRDSDRLAEMAGSLRLSFDEAENRKKLLTLKAQLDKEAAEARAEGTERSVKRAERALRVYDWTEKLAGELASGCSGFLAKYARIRTDEAGLVTGTAGRIDRSALNVITETLDAYTRYTPDGDINEIIPELLNRTVCSESSREGHLHITSIQGALACMREDLFVCGLTSAVFPGSPTENYLLLDSDLTLLADEDTAPTSENRIRRKAKSLSDLLELAASLGVKTYLSYPGYSLSELKDQNPSSALFSIYETIHPDADVKAFMKAVRKAPYFGGRISSDRQVGDAYSKGMEIRYEDRSPGRDDVSSALEREWSPSALGTFLQCPRHFYLANILGLPEYEPDDPFVVLSAAEIGTLAHTMMERLAEEDMPKDVFLEEAAELFDEALAARPPVHQSDADALKKDFLKMMAKTYDMDPHNKVISAENKFTFTHPSGVKLQGYPDRLEQEADGRYLIADFKSKRKIEHVQDDFASCMQVVVYAWLCEQAGMDVSGCEYRYLRKGKTVTCRYDDDMKAQLNDFLTDFRTKVLTGDFPRNENKDSCKYCRMADICDWEETAGEEETVDIPEMGKEDGADE